jgi:hypothetical protein
MKQSILILAFGYILITSCDPIFYTPNTHNVPLITKKGEANLTLAGNANQVEFEGAYGIANQFAVQASGGFFVPKDLDNGNGGSGKYFEVGGGYFKPVFEKFVFETYGIIGFGSMENHLPSTVASNPQTKGDISANILRYGIQPNFGFKSPHFSVAVSSRIVNLSYSNAKGDLIYEGINETKYLGDNKNYFLIEPAITIKGGFDKIKLLLQYGYSWNLTNSNFRQANTLLTLGLNFDLVKK